MASSKEETTELLNVTYTLSPGDIKALKEEYRRKERRRKMEEQAKKGRWFFAGDTEE